jgi:hypothetical protein
MSEEKNETTAIAPYDFTLMQVAKASAASGFFRDSKQLAQAIVKIQAGQEHGFGPVTSMAHFYVIDGKVSVDGPLMAAAIKRSGKYTYRKRAHTTTECVLEFYERVGEKWESLGESSFTMEDAKTAGLLGKDNWRKYPKNMLFWRALCNGAREHCPDAVFGLYTAEEMGAVVDGEAVVVEVIEPESTPSPDDGNGTPPEPGTHWIDDIPTRKRFWAWARGEMALEDGQVYEALGEERIHDFTGSKRDAMNAIRDWVDAQIEASEQEAQE